MQSRSLVKAKYKEKLLGSGGEEGFEVALKDNRAEPTSRGEKLACYIH